MGPPGREAACAEGAAVLGMHTPRHATSGPLLLLLLLQLVQVNPEGQSIGLMLPPWRHTVAFLLLLLREAAGGNNEAGDVALVLFRAAAWRVPPRGPHFLVSLFLGMQMPEQPAGSGALALAAWGGGEGVREVGRESSRLGAGRWHWPAGRGGGGRGCRGVRESSRPEAGVRRPG